ncbi:bifunctional 3-demethylubiquinol 3-O-methyltransferase/2-polyprenyl-6-hydroxyphenol methylase [Ahniella affigens]|uniref:Ubiquinone biosynthesis O-methyltransferase n=1 Tax=Ahniella affigens TaxID=2021234 RepID=A0A2P1PTC4_9GAMM|nr:bifunctional 2-polyprenyl-6-hydroxyphenol methylase/3-demethylubiquinol 3-O-methyltransferase UbiG [Ahniella affigens]AVP98088.1 bifunctional 3-demethylubiquinol 3-O-methyltransferase/2-polyprenyl-6-hydroxyphenol methylase [Ahniella affigens]
MSVDAAEIAKFDEQAARWWDRDGPSRALHDLNPERLAFVSERAPLSGKRVLDLGCGGGILSEALAQAGADVVGIDLSAEQIQVAQLHALESGLKVDYRHVGSAELATAEPGSFDAIVCMEMLEHVPDPAAILADCQALLKPEGDLFLSTIHRGLKSFLFAIVGAEEVLKLLPRGTHRYAQFIKPHELARGLRQAGFDLQALSGLHYDPIRRRAWRNQDVSVNYLMHARKHS